MLACTLCDGPKKLMDMLGENKNEKLKCESKKAKTISVKKISAQVKRKIKKQSTKHSTQELSDVDSYQIGHTHTLTKSYSVINFTARTN